MKFRFQYYLDISTSASSLTMIKIKAGGKYALQRSRHLVGAYKYYKLGNVDIKLIPASTLPVDPAGLSYDDSDPQTVDPRDQLNPGLVRITNGEDVFDDISALNDTQQRQMYVNTMLDPRWSKFMLQSGFKRHAVPLYYTVGQLQQDVYPGHVTNIPGVSADDNAVVSTVCRDVFDSYPSSPDSAKTTIDSYLNRAESDGRGFFQTGHRGRLGWMPTDAWEFFHDSSGDAFAQPMLQPLLSPELITIILPKAHKTLYYYRMFVTETIYFSGLKNYGVLGAENMEFRSFDNFTKVGFPEPASPGSGFRMLYPNDFPAPNPPNDGDISD